MSIEITPSSEDRAPVTLEQGHKRKPIGPHHQIPKVAQLLGMSSKYVQRRIKDGSLKAYRLGSRVVVPESSIQEFLSNREVRAAL